jgi:Ni,Fe-hydrogenase III small subunit
MRRHLFDGLIHRPLTEPRPAVHGAAAEELAEAVRRAARKRLGRSLAIRVVDAGSCNGCELEINALNNAFYDLERYGLRFVASPRHADVLLVTGPVTKNMREALERTYNATPDPKWVVAIGDCAFDGGLFAGSAACVGAVDKVVPVDIHVRGCPPSPKSILAALLTLFENYRPLGGKPGMALDIPVLEARCRVMLEPGPYRDEFDRAGRTTDIIVGLARELGVPPENLQEGFLRGAALAFNLPVDDTLVPDRFRWLVNVEPRGGFIVWDIVTGNRTLASNDMMFG